MPARLLSGYPAATDRFDEMLDAQGQPRPHWRALLTALAREAPGVMRERDEAVQRQVRENGVTYNVYADTRGAGRPWDLNVLPLILPHNEWAEIEAAVTQRATLLNQILLDVYGPQLLLQQGQLPPALIHGHAGFLRPCHGMRHRDGIALHFYAVDLARAPSGRWWVVADRTQAPSGSGYALENRAVIGRTFPDLMRDLNVRPLTGFFDKMRDSLSYWGHQCANSGSTPLRAGEPPLIVLLTPGPYNETYYEQAYMARHLGLPLVEGSDLTVRNGMVWHKTLSGMKRVHVIMRRVDDDYCDPLELRADSSLGIPGLIEAARLGNVLIANSLGSNLLESGALLGFLPALSQRVLGAPLKMPSVATWWCGEPAALAQVIAKLDRLVIKPSFPQSRQFTVFGQDLKGAERAAFIAKLRAHPANYVAQELVHLSQAPVWRADLSKPGHGSRAASHGGLGASAMGLRVYACATPTGYVVMPGGLTRVATGPDVRVITLQRGGGSKDTWVQARELPLQDVHRPLSRTTTAADLVRDDTHVSSRAAENLFWFGRNAERCDNIARLLRVSLNFLFNLRPASQGAEWPTVKALCAQHHLFDGKNPPKDKEAAERLPPLNDAQVEQALLLAVVSPEVPGLARQQQQLYRSASQLRERLSIDNWRALNRMLQQTPPEAKRLSQADAMTLLDDAAAASMTMAGFALDGMNRDLGWRFLSLGRRLERLQYQCQVLQYALNMDADGELDWLLELADSIVTYRSRYRAQPEWLPVLDLLLLDASNPRSILFQLDGINKGMDKIALAAGSCTTSSSFGGAEMQAVHMELLALAPATELYPGNARLTQLLLRIRRAAESMSELISVQFFSYTGEKAATR